MRDDTDCRFVVMVSSLRSVPRLCTDTLLINTGERVFGAGLGALVEVFSCTAEAPFGACQGDTQESFRAS
jgi:hypothetical protein